MATTVDKIIADARHNTNDEDASSYRVSDPKMLQFVRDGVEEAADLRPDLRMGKFTTGFGTLSGGSNIPFSGRDALALVYYVTARTEMADDEHVNSNRMQQALAMFHSMLQGG